MAATLEAARLYRLAHDQGTVALGNLADLVLLRANPLTSTAAFDTIETVIVRGRPFARADLRAQP